MLSCNNMKCPKGEYLKNCSCKSNKVNCSSYNKITLSCEDCSSSVFYTLNIDEQQGSHCVMRSLFILVLVPLIPEI